MITALIIIGYLLFGWLVGIGVCYTHNKFFWLPFLYEHTLTRGQISTIVGFVMPVFSAVLVPLLIIVIFCIMLINSGFYIMDRLDKTTEKPKKKQKASPRDYEVKSNWQEL